MNIPAFGSEFLRIGRTYDAANPAVAGIDIYPADVHTVKDNKNWFQFEYKVVKNSSDVNKLLDISGELSLKVKAGLVNVQGSGKYLSDSKKEEDTTELLAVLKCFTVTETIVGLPNVLDHVEKNPCLGTHFVRGVTYGAELVASMKIKASSDSEKLDIQGRAEGQVTAEAADVKLKAQLKSLATKCSNLSDVDIKYYATELPEKIDTGVDGMVKLIEEFPSRLANSKHPEGVPLKFALLPINAAIPRKNLPLQERLSHATEDDMVKRFDDLSRAQDQVEQYLDSRVDDDDGDVLDFSEEINNVMGQFKDAINSMGSSSEKDSIDACLEAYKKALDGRNVPGKFFRQWKKILAKKKPQPPTTSIKVSHNNRKPSAHIEAPNLGRVMYNANQMIKDWSVSAPNSYLAGGMRYEDGKLTVPITGLYYIYLSTYHNSHGRVFVKVNNITKAMVNAPAPVQPIEQVTSHVAGLFNLKENDEISFTSAYDGCVLYMAAVHTFFGAYLIELGI